VRLCQQPCNKSQVFRNNKPHQIESPRVHIEYERCVQCFIPKLSTSTLSASVCVFCQGNSRDATKCHERNAAVLRYGCSRPGTALMPMLRGLYLSDPECNRRQVAVVLLPKSVWGGGYR
jgi:hypothetical protein